MTRPLTRTQLERSNVGPRYYKASVAKIPLRCDHRRYIERYTKNLRAIRQSGYGLLLYGPNGTGKTYAASAIALEAIRQGFTAFVLPATDLKSAFIERKWFDQEEGITIEQRAHDVDFLVVEDLGKEFRGESGFVELQFENLLRVRTRGLKPVIITSNFTLADFKQVYEVSASSLAMEMLYPVKCRGEDFREFHKARMGRMLGDPPC